MLALPSSQPTETPNITLLQEQWLAQYSQHSSYIPHHTPQQPIIDPHYTPYAPPPIMQPMVCVRGRGRACVHAAHLDTWDGDACDYI
jgi:hypothetical protein